MQPPTTFLTGLAAAALAAGVGCRSGAVPDPTPATARVATALVQEQPAEPRSATKPQASGGPVRAGLNLPDLDAFDQSRAYVASVKDGTVSALNLADNSVAWTLQVSQGQGERKPESAMGIAASRDGRWVYTGDAVANAVVIVDADAQAVAARIPVPHQVHAIDICGRGHILWVAGRHPDYAWLSRTSIIDVKARTVLTTFTPGLGNDAHYAFTPDVREVWGASISTNLVSVYDAHTGEVLAAIPLGAGVAGDSPEAELGLFAFNEVAIAPDGSRAYVVGPDSGTIHAVDVARRSPVGSVTVGDRTHGVGVTRDGREVWTANNAGSVTIVDAATLEVLHTIALHEFRNELQFAHVAFAYDGTRAYVSFATHIAVIDVRTRKLVGRIATGADPHEISLEDYFVRLPAGTRVTPEPGEASAPPAAPDPAAGGDTPSPVPGAERQESRAGGVTVSAELTGLDRAPGGAWKLSFTVALSTHAGDLLGHDLTRQVGVQVDGAAIEAGVQWSGESESSHHRTGTLTVTVPSAPAESLTLVVRDIAVPERVLPFRVAGDHTGTR